MLIKKLFVIVPLNLDNFETLGETTEFVTGKIASIIKQPK